MAKWEYQAVAIRWTVREDKRGWIVEDDDPLRPLTAILDAYGGQGWELVSLVPEYWRSTTSAGGGDVETYRAVFKR